MNTQRYPLISNQQWCYPWQLRFSKNVHFSFASVLVYKHKGIYCSMLFLARRLSHTLPAVIFCHGSLPSLSASDAAPLNVPVVPERLCLHIPELGATAVQSDGSIAMLSFPLATMTHMILFWNVHEVGLLAKKLQKHVISLVWVKREQLKISSLLNILEW